VGDVASWDMNLYAAYLTNLCFIYYIDGDLAILRQTAMSAFRLAKDKPPSETVGRALSFLGIVHYQRNEMQSAEEKLLEAVNQSHATGPMNFFRSSFALALTYHARGETGKARNIGDAVLAHVIETNNRDMLQVAQAFEAELALRQGRLSEAFRWARKFQAKPFKPPYGFFLPQLTLIRTLLVQGTTDSLRQAADLLEQLHNFMVSIHNRRFQIEVLAYKALLYDSQEDEHAALKALAEAVTLAEPGGFLRLFVDMGPRMAELLKQLALQNIAVDYIGRIMAAFKEDVHRRMQGNPDHTTAQPLIDLLTNRELQILNLLAKRLQNKEIAAELSISPQTVKKHLNNIFGKLNVSSRLEAVDKAKALGIL
jgi:LuxR family maltose regulon positive regulatory protein